jgi:hypothetical protein
MVFRNREDYISKKVEARIDRMRKKLSDLVLKKEGRPIPEHLNLEDTFAPRIMKLSQVQVSNIQSCRKNCSYQFFLKIGIFRGRMEIKSFRNDF